MSPDEFIERVAMVVQQYAPQYGFCVCSPIIAEACVDSNYGRSELARNASNLFNMKYVRDRCITCVGIYERAESELWCKFPDAPLCIAGYFEYLSVPQFANLKGITDPYIYLQVLRTDGYPITSLCVDELMHFIEDKGLRKYDVKGGD